MNYIILSLISICLTSISSFAKTYPKATFENPRSTMVFFLKTMKGHKQGDKAALNLAGQSFDTSFIDATSRLDTAKIASEQLINSLDRIEFIDTNKIPIIVKGKIWTYLKKEISLNSSKYQVEISIGQLPNNQWKFTKKTIESLPYLERSLKTKDVVKGVIQLRNWKTGIKEKSPKWMGDSYFFFKNGQWIALLFVLIIAYLIQRVIKAIVTKMVKEVFKRKKINAKLKTINKFISPLGLIIFSLTWISAIRPLEFHHLTLALLLRAGYIALNLGLSLALYYVIDLVSLVLEKAAKESETKFDDILVPLINKSAKIVVVCLAVILIGHSLTLDMKSIIAGMGIGGIAFAFAAKDTLSNLFGSLMILLDQPFSIGDWVLINGEVEGTIHEVGMRSTRLRTFYDSVISIPNGKLANSNIDNYGKRNYRRYNTKLGIQYDTPPEKVEAFCEGIRQLIAGHKWTRKDYFHVYLNGLGSSSLDILVYVFWRVPDWASELNERHRLLIDILRLGKKIGVEFAFPTQTLHIHNQEGIDPETLTDYHIFKEAQNQASGILDGPISPKVHRSSISTTENLKESELSL